MTPCVVAIKFLGCKDEPGRCPALEVERGKYWCGLVRNASRHLGTFPEGDVEIGRMVRELLGDGTCDSTTVEERAAGMGRQEDG